MGCSLQIADGKDNTTPEAVRVALAHIQFGFGPLRRFMGRSVAELIDHLVRRAPYVGEIHRRTSFTACED
jgi:hypothetical protein